MKNETLLATIEMLRQIKKTSKIKTKRNFMDFFGDRIRQAATETTLIKMCERMQNLVATEISFINKERLSEFLKATSQSDAHNVLAWIREYPNLAAMIAFMDVNDAREATEQIEITGSCRKEPGVAVLRNKFDIEISATCTMPLAHGGDIKAGNASLFRRMDVLSNTKYILNLPYYAGNAIRGQVRDLLADHFLQSLDIIPSKTKPPVELWFFHCLYAGGTLEEASKATAAISKFAGGTAQKAASIKYIRDTMPALSLLGFAVGNRILSGRCGFGDWRPVCEEWGYPNTIVNAGDLIEWVFLTRCDDHEGHEDDKNSSMIANTECLKAGTELSGGVDISAHASEIEAAALVKGLELLQKRGHIGAENRRDLGGVKISFDKKIHKSILYDNFLKEEKSEIIEFLCKIEAIC